MKKGGISLREPNVFVEAKANMSRWELVFCGE